VLKNLLENKLENLAETLANDANVEGYPNNKPSLLIQLSNSIILVEIVSNLNN
jgi:hypothetical protein